jgi:hypothetical protein
MNPMLIAGVLLLPAQSFCPKAEQVTAAAGFTVAVFTAGTRKHGTTEICAYRGTQSANAFVSIIAQPAGSGEEDPVAQLRKTAKVFTGADASSIAVGDGGYAYGSQDKSAAIARKGARIYHAEISGVADKKDAAIALLKQVVK